MMNFLAFITLLFASLSICSGAAITSRAAACSIVVENLDPEPIVVDQDLQFLYPDPDGTPISIPTDETIIISCPGGTIVSSGLQGETTIEAKCISDTSFDVAGQTIAFNKISCSRAPFHTATYTGDSCESNGKEVKAGFELDDGSFVRQLMICFDSVGLNPLYSQYNLTSSIGSHESGVPRPSFIKDDFYGSIDVDGMYNRAKQRSIINNLVGLPASSTKYVKDDQYYFLSRGHLTAKADFVYAPQQTATFHYVNTAPEWQVVNGGNWNTIEMDVRDYAEVNNLDLVVTTGLFGISTLPHEDTNEEIGLYLVPEVRALGIPKFYWKLVHDPQTSQAIAIITVNNPYLEQITDDYILCDDISDSISWLSYEKNNIDLGYSYVCTYDDLKSVVPHVPEIEVTGILV